LAGKIEEEEEEEDQYKFLLDCTQWRQHQQAKLGNAHPIIS
jgi:hypothetical protein